MAKIPEIVRAAKKMKPQAVIENAKNPSDPTAYAVGERLEVTKGDLVPMNDELMKLPGRSAAGDEVVVLDGAYESVGGNNRGDVIQQCKNLRTGALMGVPTKKLRRRQGERTTKYFGGWRAKAKSALEELAHEKELDEKWVEVAPGRRVLKTA